MSSPEHYEMNVICPVCDRGWTVYADSKDEFPTDGFLTCSGCLHDQHSIEDKHFNGAGEVDPNQLDMFEEN